MKVQKVVQKAIPVKYTAAVLVAAGSASRMGGIDKVRADLGGQPVFLRTAKAFQESSVISEIVIVTRSELVAEIRTACACLSKVTAVVPGGDSRQASVALGLAAVSKKTKLVAIHDAARPLVPLSLIDRVVRAGHSYGAAAPAVPVKDTIKEAQGGVVRATPDRSKLLAVQTPQVFDYDLLRGALLKAEKDGASLTDDCSAVERLGMSVKLVAGAEENIKITTPWDLTVARAYLEAQA